MANGGQNRLAGGPADRRLAESSIFFADSHACMHESLRLYECTQDVPETPSGALKAHKLCTSSKYVVYNHRGCVKRRSSGLRVHVYMCT